MDTSLGLRHGHTLNAMDTGFIFKRTIDVLAGNIKDDLLVSAGSSFGEGRNGIFEAFDLKILGVHAEEVSGKDSRFVTSCAASDLHDDVFSVLRILRQELQFQFFFQFRYLRFELGHGNRG